MKLTNDEKVIQRLARETAARPAVPPPSQPLDYYVHPQETWDEAECAKRAKKINRDGLGTVGGPKGLINCDSATTPSYGQTQRYNGGCIRDGKWWAGETVPLPIIPESYEFHKVSSWGTVIRKRV